MSNYVDITFGLGGGTKYRRVTRAGHAHVREFDVYAAQAGSLQTRTGNQTGVVRISGASGTIATTNTVDVYWTAGQQHDCNVSSITANGTTSHDVVVAGGTGDNLPSASGAVTICRRRAHTLQLDSSAMKLFGIDSDQRAGADFFSSAPARVTFIEIETAEEPLLWYDDTAITNPITGDTATVEVSCASTDGATLTIYYVHDST